MVPACFFFMRYPVLSITSACIGSCTFGQWTGKESVQRLGEGKPMTALHERDQIDTKNWIKILSAYRTPDVKRSTIEIAITVVPLVALWFAAWGATYVSYLLTLALTIPTGLLLMRLFLIQHDCGHGAFFRSRAVNDWIGRVIGIFTMTPYDVWRKSHAHHHATSGNLTKRGMGDIKTLTIREYRALGWFARLRYRLYRHPVVMFGVGPAYIFMIDQRLPLGFMKDGWKPWLSAMGTNAAIVAVAGFMIWLVGWKAFLAVQIPVTLVGATVGVWLFYVQHQFEDTFWEEDNKWKLQDAALYGSSHYVLPQPLRWFSANIGIHHVHHLASRVPFYRLPKVMKENPELANIRRMTLWQSFSVIRLKLWDEHQKRLVSFREAKARWQAAPSLYAA